ncbi:MAG: class I SAM-dependent methyltransferase [Methanosarcinales archaeon]
MNFDPKQYWEARLKRKCNFEGVGCEGRSEAWNAFLYKSKIRTMNRGLDRLSLNLRGYKALDIGTGVGFWVEYLLGKNVNSITGIDITLSSIAFCNKKYLNLKNLNFVCGDISDDVFVFENLSKGYDLATAFDVLYHITDDEKFDATIKNIAHALNPDGYLFLTDILSSSGDGISHQQHVRWRSLSYYKHELACNGLDIIYLAPMYCFLGSPIDSSGVFSKILNIVYYGLTSKTKTFPVIERAYITTLYNFDSFLTLFSKFGVSTKLLVAKKRDLSYV